MFYSFSLSAEKRRLGDGNRSETHLNKYVLRSYDQMAKPTKPILMITRKRDTFNVYLLVLCG